jgi:membrane associated rhomboid family serine protease
MLSDRSYMRSDYGRPGVSVLTWILSALLAGFLVQSLFLLLHSSAFDRLFALSPANFRQGCFWTIATYSLVPGGVLPLVFNGLWIFLLGRELVPLLGAGRFLAVYLAAAASAGLAWLAVHWISGGVLAGASGCATAFFILFACFYPEREITFFPFPLGLKTKYAAWLLVGFDSLGLLLSELPGRSLETGLNHSAHFGGMLAAWVYFRYFHANNGWDRAPSIAPPAWTFWQRTAPPGSPPPGARRLQPAGAVRAEVDRILDKINSAGFGALTEDEKRTLDEAKDLLSRP